MKFKFCSDGDCPLWALAALHALGSLPAPVFRELLRRVEEEQPDDGIMEVLKDTNLSSRSECARAAGVLRWTLQQAWRCSCSSVQLARDLLVLGMPRAHAAALAAAADSGRAAYEAHIRANGFMVNKLTEVSAAPGPAGSVDTVSLSLSSEDVLTGTRGVADLVLHKATVAALLADLRKAMKKMEEIDVE